jgi:DUF4097 and DUF4098 domain-containing protein YvlB
MRRTRSLLTLVFLMAIAVCDLPLLAADRVERVFSVSPSPSVAITNYAGMIRAQSWPNAQIKLVATKYSKHVAIQMETSSNWVRLTSEVADRLAKPEAVRVDYEVWVPGESSLEVRSNMGSVHVEGIRGDVNIDVMNAAVLFTGTSGDARVNSLDGRVEIRQAEGIIHVTTVSGDIVLKGVKSRSLLATTATGNLSYEGDFLPGGKYQLSSYQGSIFVQCPAQASVEWNAKSVTGGIESNLPIESKRRHARRPLSPNMHALVGTLNSGDATVNLFTTTGKIRIHRK